MSGGYFNYHQYDIGVVREDVEDLIENNDNVEIDKHGCPIGRGYSENTIRYFKEAVYFLKMARIYTQRIDWLVSGDDSEEQFHLRLQKDLEGDV